MKMVKLKRSRNGSFGGGYFWVWPERCSVIARDRGTGIIVDDRVFDIDEKTEDVVRKLQEAMDE